MEQPYASQLDSQRITTYRSIQLRSGKKASTINREIMTLSGMFSFLIDSGFYHGEHPLSETAKLKSPQPAMSFLSQKEIAGLLDILEEDNLRLALLCLSTGARWGEASKLRADNVIGNRVTFVETKNGKHRTVPISSDVAKRIVVRSSGPLFPKANYIQFRQVLKGVKSDLPHGQALHVLRHTFTTHFMMNGGNIITLQRILGHSIIRQTMTYAHFSPDYLKDAVSFNPLKGGDGQN